MGLRPLEESRWLEVDQHRDEEIAAKTRLLRERYDAVVATRREGDEASAELLEVVERFLSDHYPELDRSVDRDEHPVVAASRLVQEDLCVLVRDDGWRLQAACVCFPSRWRLAAKIGASLDDIHLPVPQYGEQLARPTNSFFDRLTPARSFWRLNWTLLDRPELHQPSGAPLEPQAPGDDWFFRVERQTLRQLPRTRAVVFTIRTYVAPLTEMTDRDANFAGNLLRAVEGAPESMRAYKGWRGLGDQLRARGVDPTDVTAG